MIGTAVELGLWKPIKLRRVSPKLSHLAFADDLILFAEASLDQVEVISTCLDMFAKCSGQRVNKEKTRMFFSSNVHDTVRQQISDGFGFQRAADLGRYLGVPVGQHGSRGSTYNYVLDRAKQRMSSWKCNQLSFAGRLTLTK